MMKVALVIFREMLEISLILGIVSAATKSVKNSRIYIVAGIMGGFICSAIVAFFITRLTSSLSGYGEEMMDVAIIMITVLVVGSMAIWVKNSGARFNEKVGKLSAQDDSLSARVMLVLVVATTVFREGTEIVLFIHAIASAYTLESTDYAIGFAVGMIAGVGAAVAISYGLSRIAVKYLFKVSFVLLSLVAASLASEAAGILTSLGMVDILSMPIWDSEEFIPDFSLVGRILKMLIGYNAKPNGLQVIFYAATLLLIYIASNLGASKVGKGQNVKITR